MSNPCLWDPCRCELFGRYVDTILMQDAPCVTTPVVHSPFSSGKAHATCSYGGASSCLHLETGQDGPYGAALNVGSCSSREITFNSMECSTPQCWHCRRRSTTFCHKIERTRQAKWRRTSTHHVLMLLFSCGMPEKAKPNRQQTKVEQISTTGSARTTLPQLCQ